MAGQGLKDSLPQAVAGNQLKRQVDTLLRSKQLMLLSLGALVLCSSFFIYLALGTVGPETPLPPLTSSALTLSPGEDEQGTTYDAEGQISAYSVNSNPSVTVTTPPPPREVVLLAVGDIMVHRPQFLQAYSSTSKTYDFSPSFEYITPYLEASNLVVGNLETTLGGAERGFSGYPRFNSPDELAHALRQAGFDLLSTANNHAMDSGEEGVYRTLDVLAEAGLKAFGTARSLEERDTPLLMEVNGINLAFLAFTYGTNGIPLPRGREYLVNLIDKGLMHALISQSRTAGADLVIVYMHWGAEYQASPNAAQRELAHWLAAAGADIIIGSHPHVIQGMEYLDVESEDGTLRRAFVAYSLGNFISNQQRISGAVPTHEVEYGILLRLRIRKENDNKPAYLHDVDYLLTWLDRSKRHRVTPLPPLTGDLPVMLSLPEKKWSEILETTLHLQERLAPFTPTLFSTTLDQSSGL